MRQRVVFGAFLVTMLLVTSIMVSGTPVPIPLNELNPAAAGARVSGIVTSAVSGRKAEAAPATPDHLNGMTVYHDIQYGVAGGVKLFLDAYVPDGGPHPAVVVIHGGGWAYGDKRGLAFEGKNLSRAGFAAFVVDYRMAPPGGDWHAPTALEDVRTSVVWVRQHADRYGVDPHRVAALGNSAGGNLAMMLGTTGTPGVDRVDAVVSYSGQSNLLILSNEHTVHAAANYLGCWAVDCTDIARANSPIEHADQHTVPMLLVNSTHELMPLDQATGMADRLQQLGVPHELIVLHGDQHASAFAGEVWSRTIAFLHQYLGG